MKGTNINPIKIVNAKYNAFKYARHQAKINEHFNIQAVPATAGEAVRDLFRAKEVIGNYAIANKVKVTVDKSYRSPDSFMCSVVSNDAKKRKVVHKITPNQNPYRLLVKDTKSDKVNIVKDDTFLRHFYRFLQEAVKTIEL